MTAQTPSAPGISGFAAYLPKQRVDLADWSRWTQTPPAKTRTVVGDAFRMCTLQENVYTMAANAVLALIERHNVAPGRIGFLALATESSLDNSAGSIIVKGMVDQALRAKGQNVLARSCEVPEFKHACLAGVYALKSATRYVSFDGSDRIAIVVCSDIAEYPRGSSGEPTQGAGAIALLVEPNARLLSLDLKAAVGVSAYRGMDFRKPHASHSKYPLSNGRLPDFPVFNGPYSTQCYIESTLTASHQYLLDTSEPLQHVNALAGIYFHRPYERMADTGLAFLLLLALVLADELDVLVRFSSEAGVSLEQVAQELSNPQANGWLSDIDESPEWFPASSQVAKRLIESDEFRALQGKQFGRAMMREIGNTYTAALPMWLASALLEASEKGVDIAGRTLLSIGYGSGDAAEIIPMRVVHGWQALAQQTNLRDELIYERNLMLEEYVQLHDRDSGALDLPVNQGFYVNEIGTGEGPHQDFGIEQYKYHG